MFPKELHHLVSFCYVAHEDYLTLNEGEANRFSELEVIHEVDEIFVWLEFGDVHIEVVWLTLLLQVLGHGPRFVIAREDEQLGVSLAGNDPMNCPHLDRRRFVAHETYLTLN